MESIDLNEKQTFLDYRSKDINFYNAKAGKELNPGDIVIDQYNTMAFVKFISEKKGAFVKFIDGRELYEKDIKGSLRKVQVHNINHFLHHERFFGSITEMGLAMMDSLKNHLPHVNMFNDNHVIRVRASTLESVTKNFTFIQLGDNHSFISIVLKPMFEVEIEQFDIKKSFRLKNNRFSYDLLRDLFKDISKDVNNPNKFKYSVTSQEDYNNKTWERILKQFKRLGIKDKYHNIKK